VSTQFGFGFGFTAIWVFTFQFVSYKIQIYDTEANDEEPPTFFLNFVVYISRV